MSPIRIFGPLDFFKFINQLIGILLGLLINVCLKATTDKSVDKCCLVACCWSLFFI